MTDECDGIERIAVSTDADEDGNGHYYGIIRRAFERDVKAGLVAYTEQAARDWCSGVHDACMC